MFYKDRFTITSIYTLIEIFLLSHFQQSTSTHSFLTQEFSNDLTKRDVKFTNDRLSAQWQWQKITSQRLLILSSRCMYLKYFVMTKVMKGRK